MNGNDVDTLAIAVPSRLRYVTTSSKPLAGLRIAVKDIFQVSGIRTSICNRAYHKLYPAAKETAGCVELLTAAGAVVVGTTKLASFAATEEPLECIDFQAPWNPRADGYQSPAGSSSGSGAAIASYPWLDIAIGSDSRCCEQPSWRYSRLTHTTQLAAVDEGLATGMDVLRCGLPTDACPLMAMFLASGSACLNFYGANAKVD